MVWTIRANKLPLVGQEGHLYITIFNDEGSLYEQIHGLATDINGRIKATGSDADFINAYIKSKGYKWQLYQLL